MYGAPFKEHVHRENPGRVYVQPIGVYVLTAALPTAFHCQVP